MRRMLRQRVPGRGHFIVFAAFVGPHDRIKIFGVKIEQPHIMAARGERCHRGIAQCSAEAFRHGMTVDKQHPHQKASMVRLTFSMKRARESSLERFMS
jgi:hypothetical protein